VLLVPVVGRLVVQRVERLLDLLVRRVEAQERCGAPRSAGPIDREKRLTITAKQRAWPVAFFITRRITVPSSSTKAKMSPWMFFLQPSRFNSAAVMGRTATIFRPIRVMTVSPNWQAMDVVLEGRVVNRVAGLKGLAR
jgi:hypothetical protein